MLPDPRKLLSLCDKTKKWQGTKKNLSMFNGSLASTKNMEGNTKTKTLPGFLLQSNKVYR